MDKYVVAPPSGSTNNSVGAEDRPWAEGYFETLVALAMKNLNEDS